MRKPVTEAVIKRSRCSSRKEESKECMEAVAKKTEKSREETGMVAKEANKAIESYPLPNPTSLLKLN